MQDNLNSLDCNEITCEVGYSDILPKSNSSKWEKLSLQYSTTPCPLKLRTELTVGLIPPLQYEYTHAPLALRRVTTLLITSPICSKSLGLALPKPHLTNPLTPSTLLPHAILCCLLFGYNIACVVQGHVFTLFSTIQFLYTALSLCLHLVYITSQVFWGHALA
jgi:hypothetical protein